MCLSRSSRSPAEERVGLFPGADQGEGGELILKQVAPGDAVYLLDEHGKEYRSVEWADWISQRLARGGKALVFVIGGAYGFSRKVYDRAEGMMSLSRMTFSHQMVRTVFAEQLYRAFTIIRGEPYHHE